MTLSLLEKAKELQSRRAKRVEINKEIAELAVGYLVGEVSLEQCRAVLQKNTSSVYIILLRGLREAYKLGMIKRDN